MKMRKLIALFSAVLMLCTLIPVGAITVTAAASDITTNFDNGSRNGWSGPPALPMPPTAVLMASPPLPPALGATC